MLEDAQHRSHYYSDNHVTISHALILTGICITVLCIQADSIKEAEFCAAIELPIINICALETNWKMPNMGHTILRQSCHNLTYIIIDSDWGFRSKPHG